MTATRQTLQELVRAAVSIAACAIGLTAGFESHLFAGQTSQGDQAQADQVQADRVVQDDAFLRQHDAELKQSPVEGFSVSFADERRTFRIGETIPLIFTFVDQARDELLSPFNYEHCHGLGVADAVLDRTDGTVDPQADFWNNGINKYVCGVLSGKMGGIAGEPLPPVTVAAYLNQAVRFDRPGVYRFFIRSRHRFGDDGSRPSAMISNVLTLEIVPRDPAWEARTLAEAIAVLDTPEDPAVSFDAASKVASESRYSAAGMAAASKISSAAHRDRSKRELAARVISYLGTDAAVEEMARRFDRKVRPDRKERPAREEFYPERWALGLYSTPNRAYVVARLTRELDDANRFVSSLFIAHLAILELTRQNAVRPIAPRRYEALVRTYSARRQKVLAKAGRGRGPGD